MSQTRRTTTDFTVLTHFGNDNIVFASFVLPQKKLSFSSGTTNGVTPSYIAYHRDFVRTGDSFYL